MSAVVSPDLDLLARARAVAENAYVPYCDFPVGAALRFADDAVVTGTNVDNASSPLTACAERGAISAAVALGHRRLVAVAVHGPASSVSPCGGCRQVLAEFAEDDCVVTFSWQGEVIAVPMSELLPYSFTFDGSVA